MRSTADISDDDWRKTNPRFVGENFRRNLRIVDEAAEVAWLLAQGSERHDEGVGSQTLWRTAIR